MTNRDVTGKERSFAVDAVAHAARVARRVQATMVKGDSIDKQDRSPVTVADFAIQAIICKMLKEAHPDDPIIAEEESALLREPAQEELLAAVVENVTTVIDGATAGRVLDWIDRGRYRGRGVPPHYWTLDPIDGTKGFLRGEQYTIALALVENGKVVMGMMACPNLKIDDGRIAMGEGTTFGAVRGEGAWAAPTDAWSPVRIHVSDRREPAKMAMVESVAHADHEAQGRIARGLGLEAQAVRIDSQAKYGIVACGLADIYLRMPRKQTPNYREKIWDHAAGTLVVEEAGGVVTDAYGTALDFSLGTRLVANSGLVASNGRIHDRIIEHLREHDGN